MRMAEGEGELMPVNKKRMAALKAEYGAKEGENVYYAMENQAKHGKPGKKRKKKGK